MKEKAFLCIIVSMALALPGYVMASDVEEALSGINWTGTGPTSSTTPCLYQSKFPNSRDTSPPETTALTFWEIFVSSSKRSSQALVCAVDIIIANGSADTINRIETRTAHSLAIALGFALLMVNLLPPCKYRARI